MNETVYHILEIGAFLFLIYLGFWGVYDFILSVFALGMSTKPVGKSTDHKFLVVIPAYKEGEVLIDTASKALQVDYPREKFRVIVLAQSLDEEILEQLNNLDVEIIETGGLGSKMNAIKNWIDQIKVDREYLYILDADNVIDTLALQHTSYGLGSYDVVQLERTKSIPSSPLGILDRWNTLIGLVMAVYSRTALGVNSFVLGSAFSIQASLYRSFLEASKNTVVEDKALDLYLIKHKKSVKYYPVSGVTDSTIEHSKAFQTQRSRWVAGKVEARKESFKAWKSAPLNLELLDKWIHYCAPQRSIRLAVTFLYTLLAVVLLHDSEFALLWWIPMGSSLLSIAFATPKEFRNANTIKALLAIPKTIISIVKARITAKSTINEDFKVTPK